MGRRAAALAHMRVCSSVVVSVCARPHLPNSSSCTPHKCAQVIKEVPVDRVVEVTSEMVVIKEVRNAAYVERAEGGNGAMVVMRVLRQARTACVPSQVRS